jgi:cyclopropane-fatty-acyl-phospholipid synthase
MLAIQKIAKNANIDLENDIHIHNNMVYDQIIKDGSLGLGESYMDGYWDADNLDELFYKIGKAKLSAEDISFSDKIYLLYNWLYGCILNHQSIEKSKQVAYEHYDLGNEFYATMLDKRMIYSCGYWRNVTNLEEAQENKCRLICEKLKLKSGMKVLDIGCGWGGLAYYMAQEYGVKVVAITISEEQYKYAQSNNGHSEITYRLSDYRELKDELAGYDAVVSVGMFEHVGYQNYKEFFEIVNNVLKDDGLFLLHTIVGNKTRFVGDQWITKYIFPNSLLPSLKQITESSENLFIVEDIHNFGTDYDLTLMEWFKRFDQQYDKDKSDRFYRMWKYYLLSCAGMFRARRIQLCQTVFSKGTVNGYISLREI